METDNMPVLPYRPKWSWLDAVAVLLVVLTLIPLAKIFRGFVKGIVTAIGITGTSTPSVILLFGTAVQAGMMIAAVVFLARRKGADAKDLGFSREKAGVNILTGIFSGFVLWFVVVMIGILLTIITGPPPSQEVEKLLRGMKTLKDLWLPFISVSILAPLSEELYFRGMVFPVISAKLGTRPGMVLSALFFGSLHLDWYRLIPITVGGIGLAYLYDKTRSLLTPIIAHSVWNTMMLLMIYLAGRLTK